MYLLLVSSCQTVVDVELPESESKMVLNALVNTDSTWQFELSGSRGILNADELDFIEGAEITVVGDDGSVEVITEIRTDVRKRGFDYVGTQTPKEGVSYQVLATAAGFEAIFATDSIPLSVPIKKVDTGVVVQDDIRSIELSIQFDDPASQQFYDLRLFYYIQLPFDTATGQFSSTAYVGEIPYNFNVETFFDQRNGSTLISDAPFNGQPYTIKVLFDEEYLNYVAEDEILQLFPVYLVTELRVVSETYYKYAESLNDYQSSSFDPFAQPVQVYSNVEGGFGVFSCYSVQRDTFQLNR